MSLLYASDQTLTFDIYLSGQLHIISPKKTRPKVSMRQQSIGAFFRPRTGSRIGDIFGLIHTYEGKSWIIETASK